MTGVKDARIETAILNWAPRMVANGVDLNDFNRLTASITRWEDWCQAWSETAHRHAVLGEKALSESRSVSAGEHFLRAAMTYQFAKFMFFAHPEEMEKAQKELVRIYTAGLPHFLHPGERVEIPFPDGVLPAIFRKPKGEAPHPVAILVPGLDSTKEELHAYGDDFLRRGMAVLAVDGPGQGEMDHLPIRHDYEVVVQAVMDWIQTRPDLEGRRVGLLGVSLGGYYAPRSAAFEPRLKCVISVSGPTRLASVWSTLPGLTREGFAYHVKARSEDEALRALQPFDLREVMREVRMPLLVIGGRKDRLFPPEMAQEMARSAGGRADLWLFDDGNHVLNNIPDQVRPAQADWMKRQLAS